MSDEQHFRFLEQMYLNAPINTFYPPTVSISEKSAEISIVVEDKYFHTAGSLHGSVYFKMLDDAAFFAASSQEKEFFLLTTSFTTYITRPVSSGKIIAKGQVVNANRTQFICESILYNQDLKEVARGNGLFVRSKVPLNDLKNKINT